jgi:ferric-dicitrate binding protein FerR (iron transport regulator)
MKELKIADMIAREILSGTLTAEEARELAEWRAASADNEACYQECAGSSHGEERAGSSHGEERVGSSHGEECAGLSHGEERAGESRGGEYAGIVEQYPVEEERERVARAIRRRRVPAWRVAIAAATVAGISLALWLGQQRYRNGEEDGYPVAALPGSVKAMLLLPEGKSFALDQHVTLAISGDRLAVQDQSVALLEETRQSAPREMTNYHLLTVPRGGEYSLTLADGTKVWLNSDTRLRFPLPFADNAREVYLEGEAYFEVQRDENRPFSVRTNLGTVQVLGTAFNIAAYPENRNFATTLVTGSVEVVAAERLVRLVPGMHAIWREGREQFDIHEVDVSRYTSWIKGIFEFENTSLRDILNYLARWYNVSFEFSGEEVADLHFTGGAKKYRPLEEFLKVIEHSCEVKFSMKESVIHVSGNH